MKDRIRVTRATRSRDASVKKLLARMREEPMLRDDVHAYLGISPSGGRKYLHLLLDLCLIKVLWLEPDPDTRNGHPVYALASVERVDKYLADLDAAAPENVDYTDTPQMACVEAAPGRTLHTLRDDVEHKPRVQKFQIPSADPCLAALFGRVAVPRQHELDDEVRT